MGRIDACRIQGFCGTVKGLSQDGQLGSSEVWIAGVDGLVDSWNQTAE